MKRYFILSPLILLTLFLSACGTKAPTEKQLKEMVPIEVLQYEIDGELRTSIIDDLEIVRQQTEEKSDIADCVVKLTDDYLNRTVYITISSSYWDKGGWMIDTYSVTQPEEYEFVDGLIYNKDNFIVELTSMGFNWSEEICDVEEQGYSRYVYSTSGNLGNLLYDGSIYATATLHQSGAIYYWEQNIDTSQVFYNWSIIGNWHAENVPAYNMEVLHSVDISISDVSFSPHTIYGMYVDNCCEYKLECEEQSVWLTGDLLGSPKTCIGEKIYCELNKYGQTPSDTYLAMNLRYRPTYNVTCTIEIYPTYAKIAGGQQNGHGKYVSLEKIT